MFSCGGINCRRNFCTVFIFETYKLLRKEFLIVTDFYEYLVYTLTKIKSEVQDMQNMKKERNKRKSPRQNVGFYIALGICIVAIAAAAWTTYGSVLEYSVSEKENQSLTSENSGNVAADKEVSGEKYEKSDSNPKAEESSADSNTPSEGSTEETVLDTSRTAPIENGKIQKIFSPQNPIKSVTTSDWRTHNGIDITASEGTPVRAITSGNVTSVKNDPLLGNVITINHIGGYIACYCGVSDTTVVKEGDTVSKGDTIGYVSCVPCEMLDKSHLHLTVSFEGEYIDPSTLY